MELAKHFRTINDSLLLEYLMEVERAKNVGQFSKTDKLLMLKHKEEENNEYGEISLSYMTTVLLEEVAKRWKDLKNWDLK